MFYEYEWTTRAKTLGPEAVLILISPPTYMWSGQALRRCAGSGILLPDMRWMHQNSKKMCQFLYYFCSQNELLRSIWGPTPWFNGWRHALRAGVHRGSRQSISFLQARFYFLNYLQIFWRQIVLSLKAEVRRLKKGKRGQDPPPPVDLQWQNHCYFYQTESSGIKNKLL